MPSSLMPLVRAFFLGLVVTPQAAWPESPPWTVQDAVEAALAQPEVQTRLDAEIAAGRWRLEQETTVPIPRLGLVHEQVFGGSQVAYIQTTAEVQQQFDLSDWRARLSARQPHEEAMLRAQVESWRLAVATEVRLAFYAVQFRMARAAAIERWIAQLNRGVAATMARQTRGDVAPYAVKRVVRELAIVRARRASEASALAEAWAPLQRWTRTATQPRLDGDLAPDPNTPHLQTVDAVEALPELRVLASAERSIDRALEAWGSPGLRGWTFGAGFRWADVAAQQGPGFVISLSMPLALWNNDTPEIERLSAEHTRVRAELRQARSWSTARQQAAVQRLAAAQRALQSMESLEDSGELTRLAETAWRTGEATLAELLDAYASEAELELARIDLEWDARRADIERAHSLGAGALK